MLIGILIGVSTLIGVGYNLDHRWAKPSMVDHEKLAGNFRQYEMNNVQKELWVFEDRYRGVPEHNWNPRDLQRYRVLRIYLDCLRAGKKDCRLY